MSRNDENAVNVARTRGNFVDPNEETLSIQVVTNNKYARQVHSCAADLIELKTHLPFTLRTDASKIFIYTCIYGTSILHLL